jgi:hypothetical protein
MTSGSSQPLASELRGHRHSFGVAGTALAAAGAVLLIVSFTALTWLSDLGPAQFHDIHVLLNANSDHAATLAKAYFGWLGWVLIVAAVLTALAANVPPRTGNALRTVGVSVGIVSMALTFGAIKFTAEGAYSEYLKHTAAGFYLALGGFLLTAAGSLVGLRRR